MIVVTGGAGFIGSALIWQLNQRGITDILVVDNLASTEKWRNLAARQYVDYMHRDTFLDWLPRHGNEVTTIFHLGACSATTERDVDFLMRNNYDYTKAVWKWGVTHVGRVIYASSAATYGGGEAGYDDDTGQIDCLRPLNAYGYSKQRFDQWALMQVALGEVPAQWVGLKFFNVYGPNEYHKGGMASVVYHAFGQARDDGEIRLFKSYREGIGDGQQRRDFVYVKDAVAVMSWLLDQPQVSGLFNLGTGQARTFRELAEATVAALPTPVPIRYIDMPETLRDRYQYFTEAPMARLRAAGYDAPFASLEEGVTDYVQTHLSADDPYI